MDKAPEEELLMALTADRAVFWVDVAEALAGLEALSRVSQSGRTWQDVMKGHMASLGFQISTGHIYKIRRAYSFLKRNVPPGTSIEQLRRVKVSAVEVAERLFRLDPAAGILALQDAVADNPVPYVDLQARYEKALAIRPEMKSPRQLAWDTRRGERPPKNETSSQTTEREKEEASRRSVAGSEEPSPSPKLIAAVTALIQQSWTEGRAAGIAENRDLLRKRDEEIDDLKRTVEDLKADFKKLYPAFLEWRGYDDDVDWSRFDDGPFDWATHRDRIHTE